ncbi:MAG: RNA pseudouridine synthase [Myxococcaceae bacterium]|nr:RNA pseudouridine synthase [Myxococcaceae bacterium]
MNAPVLFRGRGFIAVDKPAGALVIPGRGETPAPALKAALEAALGERLWVVHRLDRDTSGVLLFALDAPTHRALNLAFESGRVEKSYLAIARGALTEPRDVEVALVPARRGRMRPARPGEAGKPARTLFRPVESFGERATLLEAQPLTGRTHQIRVHLAAIGHPLLVDHQYGAKAPFTVDGTPVLTRTPLHAARLRLRRIEGVDDAEIVAPLPDDFARTLEALRQGR